MEYARAELALWLPDNLGDNAEHGWFDVDVFPSPGLDLMWRAKGTLLYGGQQIVLKTELPLLPQSYRRQAHTQEP